MLKFFYNNFWEIGKERVRKTSIFFKFIFPLFLINISFFLKSENINFSKDSFLKEDISDKNIKSENIIEQKKIYVVSERWDTFKDCDTGHWEDIYEPFCRLKIALNKYKLIWTPSVKNLNDAALIILFDIPGPQDGKDFLKNYPKNKLVLFMWEPPLGKWENFVTTYRDYCSRVYTWDQTLVDNVKYYQFFYPVYRLMIDDVWEFEKKKLCTLISSDWSSSFPNELYSKRYEVIQFFEQLDTKDFEFYGKRWDKSKFKYYKGSVPTKLEVLKQYKFCICYENTKDLQGYVTEKIFDCFEAGCVPVYWGAKNITTYIPKDCFIDRRDFVSNSELYGFIKRMTKEDYLAYLENIRKFLNSDVAKLFSIEHFINIWKGLFKDYEI